MFSLGVITKSGPSFFELFAPIEDGKLLPREHVDLKTINERWPQVDTSGSGQITKADADRFIAQHKPQDFLTRAIAFANGIFPIAGNVRNLAILLLSVAVFKAVVLFSQRFATRLIAIRISQDLRQRYFEHIQTQPMSFFNDYNSGSLSSRVVGDAALIAEALNACLVNYLQTPFTVLSTLALCFLTSWQLSLIIFFGFPLIVLPITFLARRVKRISKQIQQNQERFAAVLLDFLTGIQTVKVFAMEDFSLEKYREHNDQMAALEVRSARYDLSSRPIIHMIGMFFLATALLYGMYVLTMSVAEVFFYCGLLYIFYEPIKKFAEENSHIQRGIAAAERMNEVMALKPQIEDSPNAHSLDAFKHAIEFDDVWFRYGEQWILQGVSFTVNKGETVAIIGPTGAGKSTIVQLLPRLYDIQKGTIKIDGQPITSFTQKSLREQIAFVPQKPFLFMDTIARNIAFGRNFSSEEIATAAQRAHADEFIGKFPLGYHAELAETGKNLSGGQQQRLAIARALVKRAPILVMDEATSSLDPISEQHIKAAIHELRGTITQIIIAHRLTTIEDADKIIYIDNGIKLAEGSKEELLRNCPPFRAMWNTLHKGQEKSGEQRTGA
jgi:ABC-type multidrug transport system fused ATPase/permease subunit